MATLAKAALLDQLDYELEQERLADLDVWYLSDPDHVEDGWYCCPTHILAESRERLQSIEWMEDANAQNQFG